MLKDLLAVEVGREKYIKNININIKNFQNEKSPKILTQFIIIFKLVNISLYMCSMTIIF